MDSLEKRQQQYQRLDKLSWVLDSSIKIPFTNRTIGLDGLIGLIPGVGDVAGGLLSGYIILKALALGVPALIIVRMVINMIIEGIVGIIPFFGDIFDFIFKSNRKNVHLMKEYLNDPEETTSRSGLSIIVYLFALFFTMILTIWCIFKALGWLTTAIF
ncbi:DUF4112 domain-containing protein [Leucothrix arctica]|uniref:DUF4112 domain-containing protein n=1 Tax=Leucothrix arctica TaxID=1481894 RepID=A0A317C4H0_9GAMM|nr:DUF4112 domain-containing protein [Leucothrix arctica]PWQ93091.1 DUF4112 domain-containing protein [Leucothrix arctica]